MSVIFLFIKFSSVKQSKNQNFFVIISQTIWGTQIFIETEYSILKTTDEIILVYKKFITFLHRGVCYGKIYFESGYLFLLTPARNKLVNEKKYLFFEGRKKIMKRLVKKVIFTITLILGWRPCFARA